jgi:hypothetical protein
MLNHFCLNWRFVHLLFGFLLKDDRDIPTIKSKIQKLKKRCGDDVLMNPGNCEKTIITWMDIQFDIQ